MNQLYVSRFHTCANTSSHEHQDDLLTLPAISSLHEFEEPFPIID